MNDLFREHIVLGRSIQLWTGGKNYCGANIFYKIIVTCMYVEDGSLNDSSITMDVQYGAVWHKRAL